MITRIRISNFKCLADFDLPGEGLDLGQFVCLVGMNGAGKTTVLQAFDFFAELMLGRITQWMERRGWEKGSLATYRTIPYATTGVNVQRFVRLRTSPLVDFEVHVRLADDQRVRWQGTFNRNEGRCTREEVRVDGAPEPTLEYSERKLRVQDEQGTVVRDESTSEIDFEGSIQSRYQFKDTILAELKEIMLGLKSLELLTPSAMRRRSRRGHGIGYGGEELSAFIDTLPTQSRKMLQDELKTFYPRVASVSNTTSRGGWKLLRVGELFTGPINTTATHMNDGMLRIIAILSQAQSRHQVLLFDEIENGINPELVERLMDYLVSMKQQVFVTTHSPMILNYLDDEVARESVFFLYRSNEGWTRCRRFFDIPRISTKLNEMGPGEAFVDTNLTDLSAELATDDSSQAS